MPTILTHGVVALAVAAKARGLLALDRSRLLIAALICSMLPDIDYFGFKMGIQYNSLFGHRGFTHSFFFAAIVALAATWILNRKLKVSWPTFGEMFLLLFAITCSHTLLDAMTDGGEGVAFFSPFSNHRYFFPYRPIMVSPLGVHSFFTGLRGALVLLDELLLVILPLAFVLYFTEILKMARVKRLIFVVLVLFWAGAVTAIQGLYPLENVSMTINKDERPIIDLFAKQYKSPYVLTAIPVEDLPNTALVTNFFELETRGLFGKRHETQDLKYHWASGFFANWYGGIAGRWQDPNYHLLLRTFLGYGTTDYREIRDVLRESANSPEKKDFLFKLSPAEKYDLALGDYAFTATNSVAVTSHNADALPQFWYGICNGMAAAAKWYEEPYRTVDVINPNGFRIQFHPNDVKALLGFAMSEISTWTRIGNLCFINGPEADSCRVNAGAFFIATMNRIGLAHDSFIADGFSGTRKQFYLFDAVQVDIVGKPKPVEDMKGWTVPTPVKFLAEVHFTMDFVSTLLSDKVGGEPDVAKGEGYYKKVGRVVAPRVLKAMIALNGEGNVVGGAWLGDDDVPDVIYFFGPAPSMDSQSRLRANPALSWPVIKQIYQRSVSKDEKPATIDFSM